MNTQERLYKLALTEIDGVGPILAKHLVSYCEGLAEKVFKASAGKLLKIPGIGQRAVEAIQSSAKALKFAEDELLRLESHKNVQLVFYDEPLYPKRLKRFADSPYRLYIKGNYNPNPLKSIAIVGTRKATDYGRSVAADLVKYLAGFDDMLVVSGLAYGIDAAVHKACLDSSIQTLAVMANGIDTVYPPQHIRLAEKICNNGALMTENTIGSAPDAPKFPQRNRIIAAMSDAVIVVEAAHKGGALITAEIASSYGIDVFAVPGNINQPFSKGCNKLITNKLAIPLADFDEIGKNLNWDGLLGVPSEPKKNMPAEDLDEEELLIYNVLRDNTMQIDALSLRTGIPVGKLASQLTLMEFKGLVVCLPGKQFKIK